MKPSDIVFTVYHEARDVTYTLLEGTPLTMGRQHIARQHPEFKDRMGVVKQAVENHDVAYEDSQHIDKGNRERLYCLGANESRPKMWVAVVVDYKNLSEATIVTAWQMRSIPTYESVIKYVKSKK
jgi:hypothetical protein